MIYLPISIPIKLMNLYIWIDTNCPRNKHSLKWKSTDSRWRETSDHAHTLINFVNLKTEKIWRCSAINTYKMFLLKIIFYTFYTQKVHVNGKKKQQCSGTSRKEKNAFNEKNFSHILFRFILKLASIIKIIWNVSSYLSEHARKSALFVKYSKL